MKTATKPEIGHVICAYLPTARGYARRYLSQRPDGQFFWTSAPRYALAFECENDAREVASSVVRDGYWIATKLL